MKKIHEKVLIKKTRYDLNLSVEMASKFEQLCEAYDLPKSQMADLIIFEFCKGNIKLNHYLKKLENTKAEFKKRVEKDINTLGL